jgi:hypothetical protein
MSLVGGYLAYEEVVCERDGSCDASLYREDLLRRRTVIVEALHGDASPATDLRMSASHVVYWIRATADGYAVKRGDGRTLTLLARGAGVAPGSLAVSGRRAYWLEDGQPRSVTD